MLSNDHVQFLHKGPLRLKYHFSICPAATSLRNKILYLYKKCKFQDLFQLYCDIFATNEEHNVIDLSLNVIDVSLNVIDVSLNVIEDVTNEEHNVIEDVTNEEH